MYINLGYDKYIHTTSPILRQFARLELIEMETFVKEDDLIYTDIQSKKVIADLTGVVIGDSLTIDANNDLRRSCNLTMVVIDDTFHVSVNSKIWINKKFRLFLGNLNLQTNEVEWNNMGEFLVNNPSYTYNSSTNTLSVSGMDLMGKLTGVRGGTLEGVEYVIEANSSIRGAQIALLNQLGVSQYIIEENDITLLTPYEIRLSAGSTYFDVLKELRDIEANHEMFFNEDGVFVYQKIPVDDNDPAVINDYILDKTISSEALSFDFESVKNVVEVLGKSHDVDYFVPKNSVELNTYSGNVFDIDKNYEIGDIVSVGNDGKYFKKIAVLTNTSGESVEDVPYLFVLDAVINHEDGSDYLRDCEIGDTVYVLSDSAVMTRVQSGTTDSYGAYTYNETDKSVVSKAWIDVTNVFYLTLIDLKTTTGRTKNGSMAKSYIYVPTNATNIDVSITNFNNFTWQSTRSKQDLSCTLTHTVASDGISWVASNNTLNGYVINKSGGNLVEFYINLFGKQLSGSTATLKNRNNVTYLQNDIVNDVLFTFNVADTTTEMNYYFKDGTTLSLTKDEEQLIWYINLSIPYTAVEITYTSMPPSIEDTDPDNIKVNYYSNIAEYEQTITISNMGRNTINTYLDHQFSQIKTAQVLRNGVLIGGYGVTVQNENNTNVFNGNTSIDIGTNQVLCLIDSTDNNSYHIGDELILKYEYNLLFTYAPPGDKIGFVAPDNQFGTITDAQISINGSTPLFLKDDKNQKVDIVVYDKDSIYGNYNVFMNRQVVAINVDTTPADYDIFEPDGETFHYLPDSFKEWFPNKKITIRTPHLSIVANDTEATLHPIQNDGDTEYDIPLADEMLYLQYSADKKFYIRAYDSDTTYTAINFLSLDGYQMRVREINFIDGQYYSFKMPTINLSPSIKINEFNSVKIMSIQNNGNAKYKENVYYITKANSLYSFKTNNDLYYLGNQQPRAILRDEDANSPFNIFVNGEMRAVFTGGEYDNIYSTSIAEQRARYELWVATRLNDGLNIDTIPILWADVNAKIDHPNVKIEGQIYELDKVVNTLDDLYALVDIPLNTVYHVISENKNYICYSIPKINGVKKYLWRINKNEYITKQINYSFNQASLMSISTIRFYEEYYFDKIKTPYLLLRGDTLLWRIQDNQNKICNIFVIYDGQYVAINHIPAAQGYYQLRLDNDQLQEIQMAHPELTTLFIAINVETINADENIESSDYSNVVVYDLTLGL